MLTFLIMAGGSGERFWPLSTKEKPKQLLHIFAKKSLIRLAFERVLPLVDKSQIFISTNEIQVKALKEELPEVDDSNIIIEPLFKDTAAAIGYGSTIISKYFKNPTICVLASDHLIKKEEKFRKVILIGAKTAEEKHCIVTLGIKPTYPETGYGYINVGKYQLNTPTKCLGFREKPGIELAATYLESKQYLWNSGMFIFEYSTIMNEFKEHAINHFNTITKINNFITKNEGVKTSNLVKPFFNEFEKISIDFAIMEKSNNIYVVPCSIDWDDVGNYKAFDDLFKHDENGNVVVDTTLVSVDSHDNIIINSKANQKISIIGVSNMVIVYTKKDIMVVNKKDSLQIKKLADKVSKHSLSLQNNKISK